MIGIQMGQGHQVQVFGWVAWLPLSYLLALVSYAPDTTISGTWMGKSFIWSWYLVLASLVFLPELTGHWRRLGDYRISLGSWARNECTRNWSRKEKRWESPPAS